MTPELWEEAKRMLVSLRSELDKLNKYKPDCILYLKNGMRVPYRTGLGKGQNALDPKEWRDFRLPGYPPGMQYMRYGKDIEEFPDTPQISYIEFRTEFERRDGLYVYKEI